MMTSSGVTWLHLCMHALSALYSTAFCACVQATCGSLTKRSKQSTKLVPLKGSPPMPTTVLWPKPASVVWYTAYT